MFTKPQTAALLKTVFCVWLLQKYATWRPKHREELEEPPIPVPTAAVTSGLPHLLQLHPFLSPQAQPTSDYLEAKSSHHIICNYFNTEPWRVGFLWHLKDGVTIILESATAVLNVVPALRSAAVSPASLLLVICHLSCKLSAAGAWLIAFLWCTEHVLLSPAFT